MAGLSDEAREVAKAAAHEAAHEALRPLFMAMGVNIDSPDALLELQRDFAHVRGWRMATEVVKDQGLRAAIWIIVTGFIGGAGGWFWFNHR